MTAGERATTLIREQVRTPGIYDLSVVVTSRSPLASVVELKIGPLSRSARIDKRAHHSRLLLRLAIGDHAFTIRATSALANPRLTVKLSKVSDLTPGTASHNVALASAPTSNGTTRASGAVSNAASGSSGASGASDASGSSAGASGASSGSSGSAGGSGSSGAGGGGTGANGAPVIAAPVGFAPITSYSNPVEDYEFDGSSLPSDWSPGVWNYGYQATQFQPSQVSMTGSSVALTAVKGTASQGLPYMSGWISTEGKFSMDYGMIDFRAKMPAGQGLWSGLWLDQPNGSSPWGEIDVQEMLLGNTHTVYGSLHGWAPTPLWGETQSTWMGADASQDYHDYQIVWQPGMITWAIDGVAYAQYTEVQAAAAGNPWPFDNGTGFYLIADLAVAGSSEWGGPPDASTAFPASMQIQSVKVWH